jgi:hypothetical protein
METEKRLKKSMPLEGNNLFCEEDPVSVRIRLNSIAAPKGY